MSLIRKLFCCCEQEKEACCFANGKCQNLSRTDCLAQGGMPQGPNTKCRSIFGGGSPIRVLPPVTPGGPSLVDCRPENEACCFETGQCSNITRDSCILQNGVPQGAGTTCATAECPILSCDNMQVTLMTACVSKSLLNENQCGNCCRVGGGCSGVEDCLEVNCPPQPDGNFTCTIPCGRSAPQVHNVVHVDNPGVSFTATVPSTSNGRWEGNVDVQTAAGGTVSCLDVDDFNCADCCNANIVCEGTSSTLVNDVAHLVVQINIAGDAYSVSITRGLCGGGGSFFITVPLNDPQNICSGGSAIEDVSNTSMSCSPQTPRSKLHSKSRTFIQATVTAG